MLVIANFATLAWVGADPRIFAAVMFADNFGIGFAGVALVTYMSTLTSVGYTATQYALLSSTYTYIGKFAKGFSGVMVEQLAAGRTLLDGYALFFMTDSAEAYLNRSDGWELGVGPNITVIDVGAAKSLSTTTMKSDIYAFFFNQKGLMAGLGLQGSKITKIAK